MSIPKGKTAKLIVNGAYSSSGAIQFGSHIDERAVKNLVQNALKDRFPLECNAMQKSLKDARKVQEENQKSEERKIDAKLKAESPQREEAFREAIHRVTSGIFPSVYWHRRYASELTLVPRSLDRGCLEGNTSRMGENSLSTASSE